MVIIHRLKWRQRRNDTVITSRTPSELILWSMFFSSANLGSVMFCLRVLTGPSAGSVDASTSTFCVSALNETLTVDDGDVKRLTSTVARNLGNIWSSANNTWQPTTQPTWTIQPSLPTCCLFQPSTTSFVVIIAATDSTNTTHNCRRPSFSSRRSRLWNGLPYVVTSAPTLAVFRKRLKTYLFSRSFTL